jgi:broad specificity phosphatase PhoE
VTLYLVRHAMPAVDPGSDPASWELSAGGRGAARALASKLPKYALLAASDEPKARQTLSPEGERQLVIDHRLGEVHRTEAFDDDFRTLRRRYVSGHTVPGWEPQATVAGRFAAATADCELLAGDRDLVIASHGMAMTVWLDEVIGLADPAAFWADLQFPDLLKVDLPARTVTRLITR